MAYIYSLLRELWANVRSRERVCDSPLPVNGGLECGGDREEFLACTLQECVGKWHG